MKDLSKLETPSMPYLEQKYPQIYSRVVDQYDTVSLGLLQNAGQEEVQRSDLQPAHNLGCWRASQLDDCLVEANDEAPRAGH